MTPAHNQDELAVFEESIRNMRSTAAGRVRLEEVLAALPPDEEIMWRVRYDIRPPSAADHFDVATMVEELRKLDDESAAGGNDTASPLVLRL